MTPEKQSEKRKIKRIGVLQAGKFCAIWYGLLGLIFIPFILLSSLFGFQANSQSVGPLVIGAGLAFIMPFIYALMGFVAGIVVTLIYNVVAMFAGGIEIELE